MQVQRHIFPIAQLDDAGHPHKIDSRPKVEAADDGRPRKDQHRNCRIGLDQRMRDRPAPAQVPEPEAVMAVNEYPLMVTANGHTGPLSSNRAGGLLHTWLCREMIF